MGQGHSTHGQLQQSPYRHQGASEVPTRNAMDTMPNGMPAGGYSLPPTVPGGMPAGGYSLPPTMPGGMPLPNSGYQQLGSTTSTVPGVPATVPDGMPPADPALGPPPQTRNRSQSPVKSDSVLTSILDTLGMRKDEQKHVAQSPGGNVQNAHYPDMASQRTPTNLDGILGSMSKQPSMVSMSKQQLNGDGLPPPPGPLPGDAKKYIGTAEVEQPDWLIELQNKTGGGQTLEVGRVATISGALLVRVLSARTLRNSDTGLFGDVSDPYVIVTIGTQSRRTPIIDNDLNPVWEDNNEFIFPVTGKDGELKFEVMNSNVFRDSSLGSVKIPLWSFPAGQWERCTKRLKDGDQGELEFEVRFDKGVPFEQVQAMNQVVGSTRALMKEQSLIYTLAHTYEDQQRSHAVLLDGLRVLELAPRTWTAALCGRMLAACGADVVRVATGEEGALAFKRALGATAHKRLNGAPWSDPRAVDHSRVPSQAQSRAGSVVGAPAPEAHHQASIGESISHFFGSFANMFHSHSSQPQTHPRETYDKAKPNSVPAVLNGGKRIMPMRGGAQDAELVRELLPSCDVILTDLLHKDLEQLGLDEATLRREYPGIILCQVSCVGIAADHKQPGVEDAGAFFCLTGFAEQLDHYLGPRGFAAATAASSVFGALSMAVMRRRMGGPGDYVDLSIYRAGKMCTGLGTLTGWHKPLKPRKEAKARTNVIQAPSVLPFDVQGAAQVPIGRKPEAVPSVPEGHGPGQPQLPRFSWKQRDSSIDTPKPKDKHPITKERPMERISVIEISDERSISAVALGSLVADLGAQVTKIERPKNPDPWQQRCPELYQELNSSKRIERLDLPNIKNCAAIYRTLAETTMLITNLPFQALEAWGLNIEKLRANFPHLIIVMLSAWGCDVKAREREMADPRKVGQEVDAFWEASGLGDRCFGGREMPPGLGDLTVAQHALAGIGLSMLRQQRTGQGQLVHVGHYQVGVYTRFVADSEPAAPGASPLLQTRDGRFMRLLGRGHKPHDIWVLLHAIGKRDSLHDMFQGANDRIVEHLGSHTWDEVQACQEELTASSRHFKYDDLDQMLRDKGIDWFCEEVRPVDAEALHREREREGHKLKAQAEEATERLQQRVGEVERLERKARDLEQERENLFQEEAARQQEERHAVNNQLKDLHRIEDRLQKIPNEMADLQRKLEEVRRAPPPQHVEEHLVDQYINQQKDQFQTIEKQLQARHLEQIELINTKAMMSNYQRTPTDGPPLVGRLQVRVNGAMDLKNTDTGIMGDVSDPFVTVRCGKLEYKTPTIKDNLNPRWEQPHNLFLFQMTSLSDEVELSVFNENNMFSHDCLGRVSVPLRKLPDTEWVSFQEKLSDTNQGVLDFDVCFEKSSYWVKSNELQDVQVLINKAVTERDKVSHEVKYLDEQVEMAEYARKWLLDVGTKKNIVMSIEEQHLEEACGTHRDFVLPAFIGTNNDVISKRIQKPRAVQLFPNAEPKATQTKQGPPRLKIIIHRATGLMTRTPDRTPEVYVACEVPHKEYTYRETRGVPVPPDPTWEETLELKCFVSRRDMKFFRQDGRYMSEQEIERSHWTIGDPLRISVHQRHQGNHSGRDMLGSAEIPYSLFWPDGLGSVINVGSTGQLRFEIRVV